jgi:hypothetical protein
MKNYLFIVFFAFFVNSAGLSIHTSIEVQNCYYVNEDIEDPALEFWNRLCNLQGKAFEGRLVHAPANDDFEGKSLVMHVLYCDENTILIPFNVGDDLSRTWIFTRKNGRIQLKHDHRKSDGSHDEDTMYGGVTTNSGFPGMQMFPADEDTRQIIPGAFSNAWWVTVDDEKYTYNLRRMGTDRHFSVEFDLTKEIDIPPPSWGWEDFGKR